MMRSRTEIMNEWEVNTENWRWFKLVLEVLLDIREILMEKK